MSYDNETPMNDKFLMADGSVRDSNGQTVQSANEYWKQVYDQATPIPAKFLHADGTIDENIGGGGSGTSLKYHLYAWDYGSGFCVGYTEKEVPVAGDLLFLKQDMEEGIITDPTELKLTYHVVSDADGVITVSEHPEGASGYTFTRNPDDDYEETINDVRDCVDIAQNGLLISQKGTVFKSANVNVESGGGAQKYSIALLTDSDGYPSYYNVLDENNTIPQGTYTMGNLMSSSGGYDKSRFISELCENDSSKYTIVGDEVTFNSDISPTDSNYFDYNSYFAMVFTAK